MTYEIAIPNPGDQAHPHVLRCQADGFGFDRGALMLWAAGKPVTAYAPGAWLSIAEVA